MRIFHSAPSPFVRKCMVLLHETGQINQVTLTPATGSAVDPGTMPLTKNPLGKIPALELDDGTTLYDSRVICRYLDGLAGSALYPAEPQLWKTLTLEATADGLLDAAVLMVYESRIRPPELCYEPWVEGQWTKISRTLDAIEQRWMDHLNGSLDMAHIAIGCALGYLDFRLTARDWRSGRPRLAAWQSGFAARPSMLATAPPAA